MKSTELGAVRSLVRRPGAAALLAFAVPLAVFLVGWRYVGSGDTQPAELLPISMLEEGNLDFDEFVHGPDLPYAYRRVGQHVVSAYPILPGLLNVPVYAAARASGIDLRAHRDRLSLLSASIVASLSVLFLFLALRTFTASVEEALVFSFLYAFGTCVWSVASRGMWQHGPSLLFLTCGIWLLMSGGPGRLALSGLPLALAVWTRPSNALVVLPLLVYVFVRGRRQLPGFLAWGFLPCALGLVYSKAYLGTWASLGQEFPFHAFGGNTGEGLAGLLVSPSRGLLVFSPVFLASLVGVVLVLRRPRDWPPILPYLAAGSVLLLLVYGRWGMWWGGTSFGYRLLIEILPALTLFLVPAWRAVISGSAALRIGFAILAVFSVCVHALGAFVYPSSFNDNIDLETARLWDLRDSELVLCTRKLFGLPRPSRVEVPAVWWTPENNDDSVAGWIDGSPGGATVRGDLKISGWARSTAGDVDVRIALDDGRVASPERFAFPGLSRVLPQLGDPSRAAFRASFSPPSRPGRHAVAVEFRAPSGKVRRLGPIQFFWAPG